MAAEDKHSIFIVSDCPLVTEGLSATINKQSDLTVSGTSVDGKDLFSNTTEPSTRREVMVLYLDQIETLSLTRRLRFKRPLSRTLVLSMDPEDGYPERVFRAGAAGLMMVNDATESIMAAIREVSAGGAYVGAGVAAAIAKNLTNRRGSFETVGESIKKLSNREYQVFRLFGKGLRQAEISTQLGVGAKTVNEFVKRIGTKMGVKRREVLRIALKWEFATRK